MLASGNNKGGIQLWEWIPGNPQLQDRNELKGHDVGNIYSLAFLDRENLVSGSGDGTVRLWDLRAIQEKLELQELLKTACERLRDHPTFQQDSPSAKEARETCASQ
jgi:WD40 repeat protein